MPARFCLVFLTCFVLPNDAPGQTAAAKARGARIESLAGELLWRDEPSHLIYLADRDHKTQQILSEIDGFVSEEFHPASDSGHQVAAGLDSLLGLKKGELRRSSAFSIDLPIGRFLIAGIDLLRGGAAISENAASIRAYREVGNRFVFVADAKIRSADPENPYLDGLHVRVLPAPSATGEFWFAGIAEVPPLSRTDSRCAFMDLTEPRSVISGLRKTSPLRAGTLPWKLLATVLLSIG